jgi:hypothetical protein
VASPRGLFLALGISGGAMEIATEENEQAVARVYEKAMSAVHSAQPLSKELRLVHNIEHMLQEANSGVSFEQYFRWAPLTEICEISQQLNSIGLADVAAIVERAIDVAFPNGLPDSQEAKDEATEWSEEQENKLNELFVPLEELNGRVMNVLGAYVLRVGA